jgi:hypothetical protein
MAGIVMFLYVQQQSLKGLRQDNRRTGERQKSPIPQSKVMEER